MEHINILQIRSNQKNPRIIKDDKFKKLVQSIKDFPEMLEKRPLVIDENNIVLGGNMRLKALEELGYQQVPIIRAENRTQKQKDQFVIKDNVGFGEWNRDELANEWDVDKLEDWGLQVEKFADIDFDDIKSNEDRENTKKVQNIICPECEHAFTL